MGRSTIERAGAVGLGETGGPLVRRSDLADRRGLRLSRHPDAPRRTGGRGRRAAAHGARPSRQDGERPDPAGLYPGQSRGDPAGRGARVSRGPLRAALLESSAADRAPQANLRKGLRIYERGGEWFRTYSRRSSCGILASITGERPDRRDEEDVANATGYEPRLPRRQTPVNRYLKEA